MEVMKSMETGGSNGSRWTLMGIKAATTECGCGSFSWWELVEAIPANFGSFHLLPSKPKFYFQWIISHGSKKTIPWKFNSSKYILHEKKNTCMKGNFHGSFFLFNGSKI